MTPILPPLPLQSTHQETAALPVVLSPGIVQVFSHDQRVYLTHDELRKYALAAIELNRPKVPDGLVQELLDMQVFLNSHDEDIVYRAINFLKSLQGKQ